VGRVREGPEGIYYGIELLDQDSDLWGVVFPPIEESESAIGRVLLECVRCHRRELVYLNEFEAEVLEQSGSLWRDCRRCAETSLWRETWLKANEELPGEVERSPSSAPPSRKTRDDRKHARLELQMEALIRDPQGWEEVVKTENVSRGGFRFASKRRYAGDWLLEVALPYSRGGANIFSAAKVKYTSEESAAGTRVYGVAYAAWQDAWVDRWVNT
jgi:hypothetical protein